MNLAPPSYDFGPAAAILALGLALACIPIVSVWRRHRSAERRSVLRALTLVTLFLTFDLVLLGAYTRLSDSGLGCPDWPGCYGHASPLGAINHIDAAATLSPDGPVTRSKAWIEMAHRYMATAVGALIAAIAGFSWFSARRHPIGVSPWWPTLTLFWVALQGAFGAWTVTWKLYPLVVTAHLLGGVLLVALLAAQSEQYRLEPLAVSPALRAGLVAVGVLTLVQVALGGWVSTNYAVLACGSDFPSCLGSWSPPMNMQEAFTLRRELGRSGDGDFLPFEALTAIHVTHRIGALIVLPALMLLAWRLRATGDRAARRFAGGIVAIAGWQLATGVGNFVLSWPLLAAVGHTGGATALVALLAILLVRQSRVTASVASPAPAAHRVSTQPAR
ncbi:COX15/CtaA family protein [Piscinibacter koreensis]|uniref:COX15/CtaA family protein n=1 Tax=Piscinibacter koreensis TaxID=2742824 RepID=UPI00315844D3